MLKKERQMILQKHYFSFYGLKNITKIMEDKMATARKTTTKKEEAKEEKIR